MEIYNEIIPQLLQGSNERNDDWKKKKIMERK